MRVSGKVIVDDRFRELTREFDRAIVRSLGQAAGVGIGAAHAKTSRYNIGSIKNSVKVTPVVRYPRGFVIEIGWSDFRALMFDKGTYQKLGRTLSARSKAGGAGNRGVKPGRYLAAAKRAGEVALITSLRRNLR